MNVHILKKKILRVHNEVTVQNIFMICQEMVSITFSEVAVCIFNNAPGASHFPRGVTLTKCCLFHSPGMSTRPQPLRLLQRRQTASSGSLQSLIYAPLPFLSSLYTQLRSLRVMIACNRVRLCCSWSLFIIFSTPPLFCDTYRNCMMYKVGAKVTYSCLYTTL